MLQEHLCIVLINNNYNNNNFFLTKTLFIDFKKIDYLQIQEYEY